MLSKIIEIAKDFQSPLVDDLKSTAQIPVKNFEFLC